MSTPWRIDFSYDRLRRATQNPWRRPVATDRLPMPKLAISGRGEERQVGLFDAWSPAIGVRQSVVRRCRLLASGAQSGAGPERWTDTHAVVAHRGVGALTSAIAAVGRIELSVDARAAAEREAAAARSSARTGGACGLSAVRRRAHGRARSAVVGVALLVDARAAAATLATRARVAARPAVACVDA